MIKIITGQLRHTFGNLRAIKGNSRGCLITEPLWLLPFRLYASYTSLYMLALGISESQIGVIATINVGFQVLFALTGGFITDKLGRRRTTMIFDLISWSLPTLLWAFAQNMVYFIVGAILNSVVRIVYTSWNCLLIEDTPQQQRVHVYSFIGVAVTLAGFISPVAGMIVSRFGLVPSVRGLYLFAFVSMTTMFILRYVLTTETKIGLQRMEESKGVSILDSLKEYRTVIRGVIKNKLLLMTVVLMVTQNIYLLLKNTFLSILLRNGIGLSLQIIAVVPAVHSVIMLVTLFVLMPALSKKGSGFSLFLALTCVSISTLILIIAPVGSVVLVMISTVLGGFGTAIKFPFIESTVANLVDERSRAKTMSLLFASVLIISSPFGYIGGVLASQSPRFPYLLLLAVQGVGTFMAFMLKRRLK